MFDSVTSQLHQASLLAIAKRLDVGGDVSERLLLHGPR